MVSVRTYLATLPEGVRSYPGCRHKGEPLSVWLRRSCTDGIARVLPPEILPLLDPGRPFPEWVPEVHATALYLAIREVHFPDDAAFVDHARQCNEAVLQTPSNRLLFWVAAPRAILRAAGLRWGTLHQGSSVEVRMARDTSADAILSFPPRMFPEIVLLGMATGFAAALENAGGRDVQVRMRRADATSARFEARWTA